MWTMKSKPIHFPSSDSLLISFYKILGFSFNSPRNWKAYAAYSCFFLRLVTVIASEIRDALRRKAKPIEFLSNTSIFVYPFVEFTYLFVIFPRFSQQFNSLSRWFALDRIQVISVKCFLRKTSFAWLVMIAIQSLTQFSIVLPEFGKRNWSVKRNFPLETPLGLFVESVISLIVYPYEALVVTYIPISTSIYIFFYASVISLKKVVIETLTSHTTCDRLRILNQLDDLIACFEDHLSLLPFNWLGFCLGPCLCYLLLFVGTSDAVLLDSATEIFIQVYIQIGNILITLLVLFVISKWQESVDKSVDDTLRSMETAITSPLHLHVINRAQRVLKRQVTTWFICSINRSLILSYIGSAITFSTLFIQLNR